MELPSTKRDTVQLDSIKETLAEIEGNLTTNTISIANTSESRLENGTSVTYLAAVGEKSGLSKAEVDAEMSRRVTRVDDQHAASSLMSVSSHKTLQDAGDAGKVCDKLKYRYDESLELAPYGTPLRHTNGVKQISIDESIQLLQTQNTRVEVRKKISP